MSAPTELKAGDELFDFRNYAWKFVEWDDYKVIVVPSDHDVSDHAARRTFYAGVFGLHDPRLPDDDDA